MSPFIGFFSTNVRFSEYKLRWLLLGVPPLWVYWVYILQSEYRGRNWRFSTSIRENISQTV